MKTLKNLTLILMTAGLFVSCSKSGSKPEDVAIAFQTSLMKMDFDKAGEFGTDKTKEFMNAMKGMIGMMGEEKMKEAKAEAAKTKIEVTKCECTEIDENTQKCVMTIKSDLDGEDKEEEVSPVILKKVDGKWLVDMSKEDAGLNTKEDGAVDPGENPFEGLEDLEGIEGIEDISVEDLLEVIEDK